MFERFVFRRRRLGNESVDESGSEQREEGRTSGHTLLYISCITLSFGPQWFAISALHTRNDIDHQQLRLSSNSSSRLTPFSFSFIRPSLEDERHQAENGTVKQMAEEHVPSTLSKVLVCHDRDLSIPSHSAHNKHGAECAKGRRQREKRLTMYFQCFGPMSIIRSFMRYKHAHT